MQTQKQLEARMNMERRIHPSLQTGASPGLQAPAILKIQPTCMGTSMTAPLEWKPLWDAMDATPDAWIETTEEMYYEMLECVPPRAAVPGCFLVGEAERHNDEGKAVHACFKQSGSQFFAKYMTVEQFRGGAL